MNLCKIVTEKYQKERTKIDFNDVIPETQRLDSSLQKARAQLSGKGRRQRPSRSRLRDSVSSTEGDDVLEKKVSA
ncbi:UNVERIFIED_CONTAM: Neurabin-1 [Gekko kuhli]